MVGNGRGRDHRHRPLSGRDPGEEHRAATPLELLYDLTFVVAFGTAADEMAHYVAEDHIVAGRRVRVRGLRRYMGVDQLLLVRVGLRHRRLGLPARHDGADGRRDRLARHAADVRVARPRRHARQRRDGAGYVVMRCRCSSCGGRSPGTIPSAPGGAHVHLDDRRRAGRLGRAGGRDLPRHHVRVVTPLFAVELGGPSSPSARRDALAPAPHRGALRPAGDHHARRGHPRHGRRAQRARAQRARLDRRRRAAGGGRVGLTFGIWWMYFAVPWAEALVRHRERGHCRLRPPCSSARSRRWVPACTSRRTSSKGAAARTDRHGAQRRDAGRDLRAVVLRDRLGCSCSERDPFHLLLLAGTAACCSPWSCCRSGRDMIVVPGGAVLAPVVTVSATRRWVIDTWPRRWHGTDSHDRVGVRVKETHACRTGERLAEHVRERQVRWANEVQEVNQ